MDGPATSLPGLDDQHTPIEYDLILRFMVVFSGAYKPKLKPPKNTTLMALRQELIPPKGSHLDAKHHEKTVHQARVKGSRV